LKKRIIFWILLFVFLISCVSIPAFAEAQNSEEKEKNLHQTDNYQETPTEDIKNPAGIKSNRTNYFLEEDKEDEIDRKRLKTECLIS
jgi:hypothetical protein